MIIYTIGFTRKTAKVFFELLKDNKVKTVLDIRLNNASQLAGFSKGEDLRFFLTELYGIDYVYDQDFAPTKTLLDDYKSKKITWQEYEDIFGTLLNERKIREKIAGEYQHQLDGICLLCSEDTPDNCHRRLVAEYIADNFKELDIEVKHI